MKQVTGTFIGIDISGKKFEGEFEYPYFLKRPTYDQVIEKIKKNSGCVVVQITEMGSNE